MDLWMKLLFGNWIGLLSMIVIFFTIGMAVFYTYYFMKESSKEDNQDGQ